MSGRHSPEAHRRAEERGVPVRAAERDAEPRPPATAPAPAPPTPAQTLLALQRSAGNGAVTRALLQRKGPPDPPEGVSLGEDPLPPGANVADPDKAKVTEDPSVGGGWKDPGTEIKSGTVGGVDRILLEGLPGNQAPGGATTTTAGTAGQPASGPAGQRGRAIAIVPKSVRNGPAGEIAVLVHLHGIGTGVRQLGDNPRDVGEYQMEQQIEAFVAARPGARLIGLLPIGIQTESETPEGKKYSVSFGRFDTDAFIKAAFDRLGGALPSNSSPGDVMMSAHSGGGLPLGGTLGSGRGLPQRLKGLFLFEAFHGDVGTYVDFIKKRLESDLKALEAERATSGATDADIFKAQAAHLRTGLRVVAIAGSGGYGTRVKEIRQAILAWWARNAGRLKASSGGRHEILDALWANNQAQFFPGLKHDEALATASNNLGRALATMPEAGALQKTRPPSMPAPPKPALREAAAGEAAGEGVLARTCAADALQRAPDGPPSFTTKPYSLSQDPVTVVKGDEKKKRAQIEEAPADYAAEILRMAGFKPDAWFASFTTIKFLGKTIADPIHVDLATHLKAVEAKLAMKYGTPGASLEKAAEEVGTAFDVNTIGGAREAPTSSTFSMHLFGLAIDVNYWTNPFIGTSANKVFGNAAALLGRPTAGFKSNMAFDELEVLDELLEDYFALLTDDAKLQAALAASHKAPFTGKSAEDARKQVQADLDFVAGKWERTKPARKAAIQAGGFLDLDKRLVEEIDLDWGASYGDIMHFDLRNKGSGRKIHAQIQAYKQLKEAESEKKWRDEHPG